MRKLISAILMLSAVLVSCTKTDAPEASSSEVSSDGRGVFDMGEIILGVSDGFDASVQTKATAITAVPSTLYWGASTGSAGSETSKWAAVSASVSSNKIATGKYQTATPTTYNFYVANQTFSIAAAKTTMTVANNNTDILSARVSSSSTTPAVALGHIFARTGTVNLNTQSGYSISVSSWKIVGKSEINGTAGTFNMTTNSWESASTKLTSQTSLSSSSDMYLIPGTYTIYVTYTLTKGDWSGTFTKHADVVLQQGKVNNITGTANGGAASGIELSLSVTDWGTNNITMGTLE